MAPDRATRQGQTSEAAAPRVTVPADASGLLQACQGECGTHDAPGPGTTSMR